MSDRKSSTVLSLETKLVEKVRILGDRDFGYKSFKIWAGSSSSSFQVVLALTLPLPSTQILVPLLPYFKIIPLGSHS